MSTMSLATADAVGFEPAPGPTSSRLPTIVAVDADAVGDARDFGQRRFLGDQHRRDARLDAVGRADSDAQQLDAIAELGGGLDVGRR